MTQEVFDRIAAGWYGFRHHTIFKTELAELAGRWRTGRLLNAGCGHGPDFLPFKYGFELCGADYSIEMLRLAQKYARKYGFSAELAQADMRYLPFGDESFDFIISAAAIHHIDTKEGRLLAFHELKRVLKPGGEAFVTVWNHRQPRFWFTAADTYVPWKTGGEVLNRYYHLFSYREAEKLVKRSGLRLIRSFPESKYRCPVKYFSRNICLLVKREG
jgi:tRNA (uracil-5-)-methyltransferase TRM9